MTRPASTGRPPAPNASTPPLTTYTSRAALARRAVRPAMPARLMLSGPAGSGKTWTGLLAARLLVGPDGRVVLIDTELESALAYADEHVFDHLHWLPPYDPRELAVTIADLSDGMSTAIVVDSLTHFWTHEGGTLDIVDGNFGGWKVGTPAQDDMVQAIMRSSSHLIGCVREKQAYALSTVVKDGRERQQIEKLGMQPVQREGLDYEFNVAASMDMTHTLTVTKTRCRVLAGKAYRPNHAEDMILAYRDWLAGGHPIISAAQLAMIRQRAAAIPGETATPPSDLRKRALAEFREKFGKAEQVLEQDLPEALALLDTYAEAGRAAGYTVETPEEALNASQSDAQPDPAPSPPVAPEPEQAPDEDPGYDPEDPGPEG